MPNAAIIYNDYEFNELTSYEVTERYEYDEAETTVVGTTFQIRAKTFIAAEPSSPGNVHTDSSFYAGPVMHPIRQKLSKPGKQLIFKHDGFGPTPSYIDINSPSSGSPLKDISGGPKPRVLQWLPVGNTASAEVVWECETTIPVCDGVTTPRVTGVKTFNYSIQYDIDASGYTTRRITGYIEITMTRNNRQIPDSVDDYRGYVRFQKPQNFLREISWSVSTNKRRADFVIVDTEKRTANPFPPNVIDIQAKHRVGITRRNMSTSSNTISAQITLSPLVPRVTAWYIFRSIVDSRLAYVNSTGFLTLNESLDVEEDLFSNQFSFNLRYTTYGSGNVNIVSLMGFSGLFQPLGFNWPDWHDSIRVLGPFQNLNEDYGIAALKHNHEDDRIVDLCDDGNPRNHSGQSNTLFNTPTALSPFYNACPLPQNSWVHFEAHFKYHEEAKSSASVTLGPNGLSYATFDASKEDATFEASDEAGIERWIESYAGSMIIYWIGGAERVFYKIPPPGKITVGDLTLIPAGKMKFQSQLVGYLFGQPLYRAFWIVPYRLKQRPSKITGSDAQKLTNEEAEEIVDEEGEPEDDE
ncbi:hypothetical protein SH449x_004122 [Pirellulaceae bacterium SH449]